MAAFVRRSSIFARNFLRYSNKTVHFKLAAPLQTSFTRCINTSNKKGDDVSFEHILQKNDIPEQDRKQIEKEVEEETKDWVSYGYCYTDKQEDLSKWNWTMFWGVSFTCVLFTFILNYSPDITLKEWSRREAYLELERREKLGLPAIDPDLVPIDSIVLPKDEELPPDYKFII